VLRFSQHRKKKKKFPEIPSSTPFLPDPLFRAGGEG
jgi:hypothetical protein